MIKAISLWQPWASLWLSPNKLHETRHWATPHLGPLLVHAAKKFVKDVDSELEDILSSEFGGHWGMDLPTGALLGMVDLVDCMPTDKIYRDDHCDLTSDERTDMACGDFAEGRFGWKRGPVYSIFRKPVAFCGRQGLFNVPRAVVEFAIADARVMTA
jgi:activating signal cointegrator 1